MKRLTTFQNLVREPSARGLRNPSAKEGLQKGPRAQGKNELAKQAKLIYDKHIPLKTKQRMDKLVARKQD
jgi:hypothetical protein